MITIKYKDNNQPPPQPLFVIPTIFSVLLAELGISQLVKNSYFAPLFQNFFS